MRACGIVLVDLLGGVDRHQPGRLDVDVAVGDEALDELLVLEQAAVDLAGQRALHHQVEGPPHLADRVHAVEDAAGAEAVLRGLVAVADLAEHVVDRHADVVVDAPRSGPTSRCPRCRCRARSSTPGCRVGTMICDHPARAGRRPRLLGARHMTMKKSAASPLDVNHLWPLMTHSSPSRTARGLKRAGVGAGVVAARSSRSPTPSSRRSAAAATSASAPRCRT